MRLDSTCGRCFELQCQPQLHYLSCLHAETLHTTSKPHIPLVAYVAIICQQAQFRVQQLSKWHKACRQRAAFTWSPAASSHCIVKH